MIETCPVCGKQHETGEFSFGGVPWKTCSEAPENYLIPMRKVPVVIHGPHGETFESYKYVLASSQETI